MQYSDFYGARLEVRSVIYAGRDKCNSTARDVAIIVERHRRSPGVRHRHAAKPAEATRRVANVAGQADQGAVPARQSCRRSGRYTAVVERQFRIQCWATNTTKVIGSRESV